MSGGSGDDAYEVVYTIVDYDNAQQWLIVHDAEDDTQWSKMNWTYDAEQQLWYCTAAFGLSSAAAAEAAADADPSDPSTGGCGMFAWSRLQPR
jgi:hypothetical protein